MRIELVDGDRVMSHWPDNRHQRLVRLLWLELHRQVPRGYEALPGGNVRLGDDRILIPRCTALIPSPLLNTQTAATRE